MKKTILKMYCPLIETSLVILYWKQNHHNDNIYFPHCDKGNKFQGLHTHISKFHHKISKEKIINKYNSTFKNISNDYERNECTEIKT